MYKYFPVSAASRMSLALVIVMTSGLAACSSGELALDDTYVPATHYERYPIKVTTRACQNGCIHKAWHIAGLTDQRNFGVLALREELRIDQDYDTASLGWRRIRKGCARNL